MEVDKIQSATTKFKTPSGFEWLFSLRAETSKDLIERIDIIEKVLVDKGFTPIAQNTFGKKETKPIEYIDGRACPEDNARLIKGIGKVKEKCENNKYDFTLKKNVGTCDYVVWI